MQMNFKYNYFSILFCIEAVAFLPSPPPHRGKKMSFALKFAHSELSNSILLQKAVLEPATQGRDMIGRARTGTGKTLAFGIPILDKIMRYNEAKGLVPVTCFILLVEGLLLLIVICGEFDSFLVGKLYAIFKFIYFKNYFKNLKYILRIEVFSRF